MLFVSFENVLLERWRTKKRLPFIWKEDKNENVYIAIINMHTNRNIYVYCGTRHKTAIRQAVATISAFIGRIFNNNKNMEYSEAGKQTKRMKKNKINSYNFTQINHIDIKINEKYVYIHYTVYTYMMMAMLKKL